MSARFKDIGALMLAGAFAAFIIPTSPATAQTSEIVIRGLPEGSKMEVVSFGDLNLRYISDLKKLNDRVGQAVRHVCDFEPRDNMNDSYLNCANAAWVGAHPQVHRAYLLANRLAIR